MIKIFKRISLIISMLIMLAFFSLLITKFIKVDMKNREMKQEVTEIAETTIVQNNPTFSSGIISSQPTLEELNKQEFNNFHVEETLAENKTEKSATVVEQLNKELGSVSGDPNQTITQKENQSIKPSNKNEITISFVGDCTLGPYVGQGVQGGFNEYLDKYGPDYFFENVRSVFENDDITFLNLEGPITNKTPIAEKSFPIGCRPDAINILSGSSVEVVNLSNNHIYDCGEEGFRDTKLTLKENNIEYCGEGNIARITVNGTQVSFLGYKEWSSYQNVINKITNDINDEREGGSKIVCIMFHSGTEGEYKANDVQESLSRKAIDAGADIVVSSHPHVIQGIEKYKGKVICYSLGNFSFGANRNPDDKDSMIFQQTFKIENDVVEYGESKVIPCSLSSAKDKNTYQPMSLEGVEAESVLNKIRSNSSHYSETIF